MKEKIYNILSVAAGCAFIVAIFLALLSLCCCSTTHTSYPVIANQAHTDSVWMRMWQHDSIYIRDSVRVMEREDTIFYTKWKEKYVYKTIHDTTSIKVTDSIPYFVHVHDTTFVSKPLTAWQRTRMSVGEITLFVMAVAVAGTIFPKIRKFI